MTPAATAWSWRPEPPATLAGRAAGTRGARSAGSSHGAPGSGQGQLPGRCPMPSSAQREPWPQRYQIRVRGLLGQTIRVRGPGLDAPRWCRMVPMPI